MDKVMLASFTDELQKIAEGNVAAAVKPSIGGMGSNAVARPLTSHGIGKSQTQTTRGNEKPKPIKPTNYSMVHSNAPTAALNAGSNFKMVPPPPVRT